MNNRRMPWMRFRLLLAVLLAVALLPGAMSISRAQGGTIAYGAKVYGSISEDVPRVTYTFTGGADDSVVAIVDNWTGTLDVRAELVAPNGVVIGSSLQNLLADNPSGAYLSAVLPGEGIYRLSITSENTTTGDFLLTLLGRSLASAAVLAYGQAVDVTIPQDAPAQFFTFEAEDCPTTLIVTNPDQGQPFTFPFLAKVRDQRGQIVAFLRGGEQVEDWVTVTARSGRYEVEVRAADPSLAGMLRLLVTCAGDNPGCPPGQPPLGGMPGVEVCLPCPDPDDLVPGGGCPDLNFTVRQSPDNPLAAMTTWDAMPDAEGYAVYLYGRMADSGEVYLTHAVWTPGDPTRFTWFLPEGYISFRFVLRVYIGDSVVCVEEASLEFESPPERIPACAPFSVWIASQTETSVTFEWSDYPGADGYVLSVLGAITRTILPGWPVVVPASQHSYTVTDPPVESFILTVGPWDDAMGGYCIIEQPAELSEVPTQRQFPCLVRADGPDVPARVGPGADRSIFAWLAPGVQYPALGMALDGGGARWWQLDKTMFPGHEMVISLWTADADVTEIGDCEDIPPGDVPPLIPWEPDQPQGQWLPCGSCDTCGHPASECVTSPEGECLWDPATCRADIPPDDGSGCYAVSAAIDMGPCFSAGSAMLDTPPNCGSRYTPGTTISAHAVAVDPKCNVDYWSGCGASGSDNSITFTPGGSCTITAHMHYGN